MAGAEVGDDWFGEDPTVRALEEDVAGRFGHETAVYVPSGTMGNTIALRLLAEPGSEILADNDSHVVTYEMGSLATIGGIQTRTLRSHNGVLSAETVAAELRVDPTGKNGNYSRVTTRALAVENTHVRSGGRAWRLAELDALVDITAPAGVAMHCDGARIWNAAVATGIGLGEYGRRFTTLSVCLSKGLGAPVGSLVVTDAARAQRARVLRRQVGGAMRQSGIIAAGGLYAVRNNIERLADDHRRAQQLAAALADVAPNRVDLASCETNIVLFEVRDASRFLEDASALGVLLGTISPTIVRAVTHLDIDDEQIEKASSVLQSLLEADTAEHRRQRPFRAAFDADVGTRSWPEIVTPR